MYQGFFVTLFRLKIIRMAYALTENILFLKEPTILQSVQRFICKVVPVKKHP